MNTKLQSIPKKRGEGLNAHAVSLLALLVLVWWAASAAGMVESFILPSPAAVLRAFYNDFALMMHHSRHTLSSAVIGMAISLSVAFLVAVLMDRFGYFRKSLYPLLVLSQAVPYIAIAPLLVVWLGHGMAPRIVLVSLTCFFPIAVGLYDGMRNIQREYLDELKVMGGRYAAGLRRVKLPLALPSFFSGLKIAAAYAFVGAVISEWTGGTYGLGVYMTRVRRSFEFDKMFAAILLVVAISLVLMLAVKIIEKRMTKHVL